MTIASGTPCGNTETEQFVPQRNAFMALMTRMKRSRRQVKSSNVSSGFKSNFERRPAMRRNVQLHRPNLTSLTRRFTGHCISPAKIENLTEEFVERADLLPA